MPHADEGRLHAYLDGALHAEDPEAARALERHVDACADCRALLESEREIRDDAGALLGVSLPPSVSAAPPWDEILHRAGRGTEGTTSAPSAAAGMDPMGPVEGAGKRPGRRGRIRWLPAGRPLAWAASVVLALGVGWWSRAALGVDPFEASLAAPRVDDAGAARGLARDAGASEDRVMGEASPDGIAGRDAAGEGSPEGRRESANDALGRADAGARQARAEREAADEGEADVGEADAADAPSSLRFQAGPQGGRDRNDGGDPAPAFAVEESEQRELTDSLAKAAAAAGARVPADDARGAGRAVRESTLRRLPPEERVAGEPFAPAAPAVEQTGAPADDGWVPVDVLGARALLGRPPVGVPDAELLSISWGAGGRTVRVSQRIATGERIDLYQWSANDGDGAGPVFGGAADDSGPRREGGIIRGYVGAARPLSLVVVDGLLVAGAGALGADALRALLGRLAPLESGR